MLNEMTVIASPATENRRAKPRINVGGSVQVIFGRCAAVLIDLSEHGARIRHFVSAPRGSAARVSFAWEGSRFSASAEVLASRVITLGADPSYESRVRFLTVDSPSHIVLTNALAGISGRHLRRWVANMRGWSEELQPDRVLQPSGWFLRCRLRGTAWERKRTSDATQPEDGFLLPSETADAEIETLCALYSRGDEDDRQFIRSIAAAVAEESLAARR
jgi:hypothetical protein